MRHLLRRLTLIALAALAVALILSLAACGGDDSTAGSEPTAGQTSASGPPSGATVLAAASLTEVFQMLAPEEQYSFAASDALALQIREGAPADVFASANTRFPNELLDEGLLDQPQVFATNRLVLIVPEDNPAGIQQVQDLAKDGVKLVLADEGIPVGDYSREALTELDLAAALQNVVSLEDDVKAVTGKVALGEADAGMVYATDVRPVQDQVTVIEIPASVQPTIEYGIGVVKASPNREAAQAFVDYVLGPEGQQALTDVGFGIPGQR